MVCPLTIPWDPPLCAAWLARELLALVATSTVFGGTREGEVLIMVAVGAGRRVGNMSTSSGMLLSGLVVEELQGWWPGAL